MTHDVLLPAAIAAHFGIVHRTAADSTRLVGKQKAVIATTMATVQVQLSSAKFYTQSAEWSGNELVRVKKKRIAEKKEEIGQRGECVRARARVSVWEPKSKCLMCKSLINSEFGFELFLSFFPLGLHFLSTRHDSYTAYGWAKLNENKSHESTGEKNGK